MAPHPETWLKTTPQGLFCEPGGFFLDPARPVPRAVITHGHADHARPGHGAVLATAETLDIMRARYGADAARGMQAAALHEGLCNGIITKMKEEIREKTRVSRPASQPASQRQTVSQSVKQSVSQSA